MVAVTPELLAARAKWRYRGDERPPFADTPEATQESVWDYPRPPRVEADRRRIRVLHNGVTLAESSNALRVLETASPPTFYLPPGDVDTARLRASPQRAICEWKGVANEFDLAPDAGAAGVRGVAWSYLDIFPEFAAIRGFFAFYPAKVRCLMDGAVVEAQPGGYYGGWITAELVGPFKGEVGSENW